MNNDKKDFNIYKLYKIIVDNIRIILSSIFIALIFGILYAVFSPKIYESKTSIVDLSYDNNSFMPTLSDVSPLLKGLGGSNSGDRSIPYFIPDIVESRVLKEKILSLEWKFESLDKSISLFDFWNIENETSLEMIDFAISKLEDMIGVEVTESGLYVISVLSEDRALSVNIANFISTYIVDYVNNKQSDLKLKALDHTLKEIEKVNKRLENAENKWLNFRKLHPMINDSPALILEEARFQREIQIEEQILVALEVERAKDENAQSKLDEVVAQLDPPRPSYQHSYPKTIPILIISFIFGIIFSLMLVFLKITRKNIYRELSNI